MADIYQIVTDKFVDMLEQGVCPWHKPWKGGTPYAVKYGKQEPYSFLNQMLLGFEGEWIGFNEAKKRGGNVKKGAKSHLVVFWKMIQKEEETEGGEKKIRLIPCLQYKNVFQVGVDTEGIAPKASPVVLEDYDTIDSAESVIENYIARSGVTLRKALQGRAYYSPSTDSVTLPLLGQFESVAEYYSAAFHELAHSTGTRLGRAMGQALETYTREELVAEIASAFCMARLGIATDDSNLNSAAYLQGWLKALKTTSA